MSRTPLFCIALLLATVAAFASVVAAGPISYDPVTNRPLLFEGVTVDGSLYDVEVVWNGTYDSVYDGVSPLFTGDEAGALAALTVLIDALVADGYTSTGGTAYLDVPFDFNGTYYIGWGDDLHDGLGSSIYINTYGDFSYGTVGYTVWREPGSVPNRVAAWGDVKALFRP